MRFSRTSLAFAALLLVSACGTGSPEVTLPPTTTPLESGASMGTGNLVLADSTAPHATAERGGLGLMGSGN